MIYQSSIDLADITNVHSKSIDIIIDRQTNTQRDVAEPDVPPPPPPGQRRLNVELAQCCANELNRATALNQHWVTVCVSPDRPLYNAIELCMVEFQSNARPVKYVVFQQ